MRKKCKTISIFGATGSIGVNTLDIIAKAPQDDFKILALSANKNYQKLAELSIKFQAELAVIADETHYQNLKESLSGTQIKVAAGESGMLEMCALKNDLIVAAIVGSAGLLTTYNSLKRGANVLLANKESLVCAGNIIKSAAHEAGVSIIPVDSEHNAIFQVFEKQNHVAISKIILTASGGPFRKMSIGQLRDVTVEEALNHPNWKMGPKITIDSATLFNKGLEIIEAHYLFDMPVDKIEVVVHPESIIHSMVSYADGSTLAELGHHDMRTPITHALYWPERYSAAKEIVKSLNFFKLKQLTFEQPDNYKFPSLNLCREAINMGGTAPIMLNASNEIAVELFLQGQIKFTDIFRIVESMLNSHSHHQVTSLNEVIMLDREFKIKTKELASL